MQVAIRLIERGNDLFVNNELSLYELTLCTLSHTILNNIKRIDKTQSSIASLLAEGEGFEPPEAFTSTVFKSRQLISLPLVAYRY